MTDTEIEPQQEVLSTEPTEVLTSVWASNSSLGMHRACPQRWMYAHMRRLERLVGEIAVEKDTGSWWHAIMAADSIRRGRKLGSMAVTPDEIKTVDHGPEISTDPGGLQLPLAVLLTARDWWKAQDPYYHEAFIEKLGQDLPNRLRYLYQRWTERWAEARKYERPLAVELRWQRELPSLPAPGPDGVVDPKLSLVGYIDEVYIDTRRNLLVIRDHKGSTRVIAAQTVADDMMDSQLQLYAWGAAPLVSAWEQGGIQATAYDRIRMSAPPSPQVTATGNLSKSVTGFDLHTYREWVKGPDGEGVPWGEQGAFFVSGPRKGQPKFGRYTAEESVIERLSRPDEKSEWHQRTLTPLNSNLIRAHLRAAVDTAADMAKTRARAQLTHEAPRNLGSACRWCDFSALCRFEMHGGPDAEVVLLDVKLQKKVEKE